MSNTAHGHKPSTKVDADRRRPRQAAGRRRPGGPADAASPRTPTRLDRGDAARANSAGAPRRIDLVVVFAEEPDACCGAADDDWRMLGLDPDELCVGSDGLVRLTVV